MVVSGRLQLDSIVFTLPRWGLSNNRRGGSRKNETFSRCPAPRGHWRCGRTRSPTRESTRAIVVLTLRWQRPAVPRGVDAKAGSGQDHHCEQLCVRLLLTTQTPATNRYRSTTSHGCKAGCSTQSPSCSQAVYNSACYPKQQHTVSVV